MASPVRAVRRALTRVPRAVLAATALFAALLALWSIALPLGDAPDETAHADLVFHLATGAPYPGYDGRHVGVALSQLCFDTTAAIRACPRRTEVMSPTGIRRHTAANAPAKGTRRTFDAAGGDREIGPFNQMLQHPPLYYEAMSGVVRIERLVLPGTDLPPLGRELALLRLANVVLIAPLPLLAWWTCKRLGLGDDIGTVAALVPLTIPQLCHIGSTLNNDNLLTLLVAALTVLLAGVTRGDLSRRTAVAVGAVTALALLTKAFALVLPIVIGVAYVVAWRRRRAGAEPSRAAWVGLATAAAVTATLGGWWYLRNLFRGDGLSPSTETARLSSSLRPHGFHAQPWHWLGRFATLFTERFWGWFGWYTVRISIAVIVAATALLLAAVAIGCWRVGRPPHIASRWAAGAEGGPSPEPAGSRVNEVDVAIVLLPAVLLGGFVLAHAWSLYTRTGQLAFIQGRYLFAAIVGIAAVAAIGVRAAVGRWAAVATLAFAVVMQVEGLRRVLSGYWGPRGSGPLDQLRALVAWSPWPGELIVAGGAILLGLTAWLAFEVARTPGHRHDGLSVPAPGDPIAVSGATEKAHVHASGLTR